MPKVRSFIVNIYTNPSEFKTHEQDEFGESLLSTQVISVQYFDSIKKWVVRYIDSNSNTTQVTCDEVVTVQKSLLKPQVKKAS